MTPSRNAIRSYHVDGTEAGIADALAEIDSAAIPKVSLILFIQPSTHEGGRIRLERFMVSGVPSRFGANSWLPLMFEGGRIFHFEPIRGNSAVAGFTVTGVRKNLSYGRSSRITDGITVLVHQFRVPNLLIPRINCAIQFLIFQPLLRTA